MEAYISGQNLGDNEARVHTSFLRDFSPLPGRNFRVGIRGEF
jgi:iron complex outermembrane receptor protein